MALEEYAKILNATEIRVGSIGIRHLWFFVAIISNVPIIPKAT